MSIESANAFYQRITTDEAFRTQLQNTASEGRTAIIQAAGYDFTPEEWEAATADILEASEANTELNDAQLEAIAGGILPVAAYGVILPPNLRWPKPKL
ncbi:Nif11-like leader peptide family natural product precursor [Scytonema hofmannii PCC 7110]|uniref:Nif11-like leader peptide family natural product n=1 Tax=Scytonema hofmannii PCC 7110 TaxID=128403 RepID=A0A139X7I0_9CYAN|nr:Nif11-like leader peptide family natural product precursor [Scytonema hofmannii]KYC40659.1 Nif11-like leader peptide family natural product precursor [Scytonema hofmannii PCC 7110]